jgi:hypothetical protein
VDTKLLKWLTIYPHLKNLFDRSMSKTPLQERLVASRVPRSVLTCFRYHDLNVFEA